MDNKQISVVLGGILGDYCRLLDEFADFDGYEYLKNLQGLKTLPDVLDCVKYRNSEMLKNAYIENDNICYITNISNSIASDTNCQSSETPQNLESIFNVLNANNQEYKYDLNELEEKPNIPQKSPKEYDKSFYKKIIKDINNLLENTEISQNALNYLLSKLEIKLLFVPNPQQADEIQDVSLFDHLKMSVAFASCIERFFEDSGVKDYKSRLFLNEQSFYNEKAFLIYSVDFSGIQQFIYSITATKNALKGLRSRSFYLEILMETLVDEILQRLKLSRANVLYTGGGHTYFIFPNTRNTKDIVSDTISQLNQWFVQTFDNSLYGAAGFSECSVNDLKNNPCGSYKEIFSNISKMISKKKSNRYSTSQIIGLNTPRPFDYDRECNVCHRMGKLDESNVCEICRGLIGLSEMILDDEELFVVVNKDFNGKKISLPFEKYLTALNPCELKKLTPKDSVVRSYSKNNKIAPESACHNLWVGSFAAESEFSKLVANSKGIKRLGVIRADVDNLGQSFVSGFSKTGGGEYETITRTSAFSRRLSEFFKYHINYILKNPKFQLFDDNLNTHRNATIVYSGGDDLFIVGGWDDIVCFAVDLHNALKEYTQNTLSISAGIGLYHNKYPIYSFANEVEELVECSKSYEDKNQSKNAVTLFDENNTYSWDTFIQNVVGQKLKALKEFIVNNDEHGKAMLYTMLELIREKREDRLNIARFAYFIARIKPKTEDEIILEKYEIFKRDMYQWINNPDDCRQLETAIYIYIYMNRKEGTNDE